MIDPLTRDMLKLVRAFYQRNPPARQHVYTVLDALAATAAVVLAGTHPEWEQPAQHFELRVAEAFNHLLECMRREQDAKRKMQ